MFGPFPTHRGQANQSKGMMENYIYINEFNPHKSVFARWLQLNLFETSQQ